MPKNKYTIVEKEGTIKIFINSLVHLALKKESVVGFQSWIEGKGIEDKNYHIEFYLIKKTIRVEYDQIEKWKAILKLIETINIK